jgi:uncharacterized protein YigA (DUF484 family)
MSNWPEFYGHPQSVLVGVEVRGSRTYHVSLDEQQYNEARDAIAKAAELRQLLSDLYQYSQWGGDSPNFAKIENAIRATAPKEAV